MPADRSLDSIITDLVTSLIDHCGSISPIRLDISLELETLYRYGKGVWPYGMPEHEVDQQRRRNLCEQTLAFENYYFAHYHTYLLGLLYSSDDDRQFAAERLNQVVYGDEEMIGIQIPVEEIFE